MAEGQLYYSGEPPVTPKPKMKPTAAGVLKFPYPKDINRLNSYSFYSDLFLGDHFRAFNIKIDNEQYGKNYSILRYITVNFAKLLSFVVADMLFSEPIKVKVEEGDQEFVDGLMQENSLHVQLYESALANSYMGDDCFKLRVGPRMPQSKPEDKSLIIENFTAKIFFPMLDEFNTRQDPETVELAWTYEENAKKYLKREIHKVGEIETRTDLMEGDEIKALVSSETVPTNVDFNLITHVPNWRTSTTFYGYSDYLDLVSIFYAINNRVTKIDNILDKHSDPILALPEGILDEKGKVKKSKLGLVEIPAGQEQKPEYIVWNANLEAAFNEIDKLVEMFFMVSETSPDILGMGKGVSDSGRALKLKLLRTIAKVARKKLYYDKAIKDIIYKAQVLAKTWGLKVDGKTLNGEPVRPEIEWADGIPVDAFEQLEVEEKAIDIGITDEADAMMRVYGYDEDIAEEKSKKIKDAQAVELPKMNTNNPFSNKKE